MFSQLNQFEIESRYGNELKRRRMDRQGNHMKVWRVFQQEPEKEQVPQPEQVPQQEQQPQQVQQQVQPQQPQQPTPPMQLVGRTVVLQVLQNNATHRGTIQSMFVLNGERAIQIQTSAGENLIFTSSQIVGAEVLMNPDEDELSVIMHPESPRQEEANRQEEVILIEDDDDADSDAITELLEEHRQLLEEDDDLPDFPDVMFISTRNAQEEEELQNPEEEEEEEEQEEEEERDCCAICLDITDPARNFVSLDCGHQFHFACIMGNMANGGTNRNQCPMCRSDVMQHYDVHNEENYNVEAVIENLARSNQRLQEELDLNRQHRDDLTEEYVRVMSMNLQISSRHQVEREAREALEHRAIACHLNERIARVVASAVNNDVRQNHTASVHLERQIRELCMSFGMTAYDAQYDEEANPNDNDDNESHDEEEVQQQQQPQQQPQNPEIIQVD